MKEHEIYSAAIERWGVATQVMMAMGEFGELIAGLEAAAPGGRLSVRPSTCLTGLTSPWRRTSVAWN